MKVTSILTYSDNTTHCMECKNTVRFTPGMLKCPYCNAYILETIESTAEEATYNKEDDRYE